MANHFKQLSSLFFLLYFLGLSAQEIPPIKVFTPQDYNAEDQNWSITQNDNGFLYVANNVGLLEYTGANWNVYKSPNNVILRSVKSVNDVVYTGGYMEFGYWRRNGFGKLFYTSLVAENEDILIKEDEEIWGIINIEEFILFQSFESIYIYNELEKTFRTINSNDRINKIFEVDGVVYFQKSGIGLFKFENGQESLLINSKELKDIEVINVFNYNNEVLLLSKENGFYLFSNGKLSNWITSADPLILNESIYSGLRLQDGSFVLGTISNGILIIDSKGNLLQSINQSTGLSNNTILSLEEDSFGNIWLGLDNGINVINYQSPYMVYKDKLGVLGTVYVTEKFNEVLYLGTNQGLFNKSLDSDEGFSFVEGTNGQVWTLKVVNGKLFCGHDKGTFQIENNRARLISDELGTWNIKSIEDRPDLLLTGNYKGLFVLHNVNGQWRKRNKIEGFNISSRYAEFISKNEILIGHEYKGVYKIIVDTDFRSAIEIKQVSDKTGSKSSIVSYNNSILYCNQEGVFTFNNQTSLFEIDSLLSSYFSEDKYASGKLIYDQGDNRLWGFPKHEIVYVEPGKLTDEPLVTTIPIPSKIRKGKSGYDNILYLKDQKYLIGTTEGYLIMDLNKFKEQPKEITLNSVAYSSAQGEFKPLTVGKPAQLKTKENSLRLKYSVPNYNALSSTTYQYRLLGNFDNWSSWTDRSEILFENLPHGNYTFEARAKTDDLISKNVASFEFNITKPWYLSTIAILTYSLAGILILYAIHYLNRRYYKKQRDKLLENKARELELEQLENQRQLIQFKNKNLQLDIDNKNRELGIATMNLVKRNELLNNIKDQLSKSKSLEDVKVVIRHINASLKSTGDWKLFEEAFNNVDKDFIKKIKSLHPSITPNDLRLCTYLRLNLSSKEIAPLLNISHKSVEVKRYRLRKKMGLDHNQSLSNYIIEL
ncbi:triple tyrosine motif-containing protein [Winogradskyella alexanderae]|uniref:LuxR C-terminal-related transcriptional regulator n=1 Tax=Winogradskyella alexanderae TaxID=2877123 RepID=A0ABS7XX23_9FLAO|nr:triple tyrosine motif-containing protein [Winogradskyella alexanderae]MCA0133376.1 LuxR C-terminal-related transcriptional regulator [Winogradskyella alexanderae]